MGTRRWTLSMLALVSVVACKDNPSEKLEAPDIGLLSPEATNEYVIAKGCYALQALATEGFVVRDADGAYRGDGTDALSAEPFFMQPTGLGKYVFYATDETMLADSGGALLAQAEPSEAAIWSVSKLQVEQGFSIVSTVSGQALVLAEDGQLTQGAADSAAAQFQFVPSAASCKAYPEMPLSIVGKTYKGRGIDQPIVGFADVHTHMGMSSELSTSGEVGPSAGGVLYGETFNKLGVSEALKDCEEFHGPDGRHDANNVLTQDPTGSHDTQGWPTFTYWPKNNSLTHQVMYYRWVERAYMAGLRLMVTHGTNIAGLCEVGKTYSLHPDADCNDMSIGLKQLDYLYELQDYIDAQSGGPGEGWFRIVLSPLEARQVINDGKMAVVLGLEAAQVFDCGVTMLPGGQEVRECDAAQIDAKVQEYWDKGVRHIYPFHDIDSSLGGTGIFSGDVMNLLNFYDTGAFWKTTECREYPADEPTLRTPGAQMATALPGSGSDPLTTALFEATGGVLPVYPPGVRCNARDLTDLGVHAINAMMDQRFVIDIDHAAYHSKDKMLDMADERTPTYPFASTHSAHGGLSSDQSARILAAGGIIYRYKGNGRGNVAFNEKLKFWREKAGIDPVEQPMASGYGADGNGFGGHPGPRGGDSVPVNYPFTLFSGEDWGPMFDGIEPITVEMLTIPESGKFWNIDEVGMANYGLVADYVEEVRLESGAEGLEALYNSAEAYVRLWENVYNRD